MSPLIVSEGLPPLLTSEWSVTMLAYVVGIAKKDMMSLIDVNLMGFFNKELFLDRCGSKQMAKLSSPSEYQRYKMAF